MAAQPRHNAARRKPKKRLVSNLSPPGCTPHAGLKHSAVTYQLSERRIQKSTSNLGIETALAAALARMESML